MFTHTYAFVTKQYNMVEARGVASDSESPESVFWQEVGVTRLRKTLLKCVLSSCHFAASFIEVSK